MIRFVPLPNRLISCLLLVSWAALNVQGADRRREEQKQREELNKAHQELKLHERQLEDIKVKRWQDKRNAVAAQEAFTEAWNEIKTDVDRLTQIKNQKEETLLRLENQEKEKKAEVEEAHNRLKQFGLQIKEKILELERENESSFPAGIMGRIAAFNRLKFPAGAEDPGAIAFARPAVLSGLFDLEMEFFALGESRAILRDRLAVKGLASAMEQNPAAASKLGADAEAKMAAGHFIRLGTAYQAFVSSEGEDVAILAKTGRIDGKAWDWVEDLPEHNRKDLRGALSSLIAPGDTGLVLLPMDVLLTKATGAGFTAGEKNTAWIAFKEEFRAGGFVMPFIFSLLGLGILIVLQKMWIFSRSDQNAAKLSVRVQALAAQGKRREAMKACEKAGGAVGRALHAILGQSDNTRDDAESRAHEVMLHEAPKLEKGISTMNILAAASPLVGLLGTVSGMVTLFEVITVHGTSNPKLMADGISEALIATKWGLMVAIPLLLAYNWLDTWSVKIVTNMEKYSAALINEIFPYTASKPEPVSVGVKTGA